MKSQIDQLILIRLNQLLKKDDKTESDYKEINELLSAQKNNIEILKLERERRFFYIRLAIQAMLSVLLIFGGLWFFVEPIIKLGNQRADVEVLEAKAKVAETEIKLADEQKKLVENAEKIKELKKFNKNIESKNDSLLATLTKFQKRKIDVEVLEETIQKLKENIEETQDSAKTKLEEIKIKSN